jgi:arylsulfatase A-like enzyme
MAGGGSIYIIDPAPGDEFIGRGGEDITVPPSGISGMPNGNRLKELLEQARERSPITRNHEVVRVDEYLTEALTKEAVGFIDRNQKKPFFLYLAQHVPHAPLQAPQKYIDRFRDVTDPGKRVHAAMVAALDDSVGAVVQKLKEDGLYENTLVIFLSDNGCPGYIHGACSNAPLSGFKRWQLEGGIRIPYIASWPGHLPAGKVDNRQVSSLDILPTAAALAHAKLPQDRVYDGVDLLPYLTGADHRVPNPKLYWRDGPNFAMRDANLKLWIVDRAPQGTELSDEPDEEESKLERLGPKKIEPKVWPEGQVTMLFNLDKDIGEKQNLAAMQVSDLERLKAEIARWNKTLVKPMWPTSKHSTVDYDGEKLELFY